MAFSKEEARERKNARQREYNKRTGYAQSKIYAERHKKKVIGFAVFSPQDDDIIEHLDSLDNKSGYIKDLIRADLRQKKSEEN